MDDWFNRSISGIRTPWSAQYRWILVGATLLYLLSPIDISPDVIPILGWIDGIVASLLVASLSQMLLAGHHRRRQHGRAQSPGCYHHRRCGRGIARPSPAWSGLHFLADGM
jgi:uncharacterized membrane protein YkvA (DUF1232 family)